MDDSVLAQFAKLGNGLHLVQPGPFVCIALVVVPLVLA